MNVINLKERQNISENSNLSRIYFQFGELIKELEKKELPDKIIKSINQDMEELNSTTLINNALSKLVKQKQTKIIKIVEKELKIVPINYYRNIWLAVGMSAIGLPIGVVFGSIIGNMGLLAVGLPIGMGIGIAIGTRMDKKAFKEGRQLNLEVKY